MNWTPEAVNQLRDLVDTGISASQVAAHFPGCTRNSIIGKVNRLGLKLALSQQNQSRFDWTDARITELRDMARNGSDVGACARFFNISQGAIRAAAKRFNVFIMSAVPQKRVGKYGGITFRINHRRAPLLLLFDKPKPTPLPFLALTLTDLEPGHCRYPQGDGHITYCGQEQMEGSSYCEFHHGLTHHPTKRPSEGFVRFLCAAE